MSKKLKIQIISALSLLIIGFSVVHIVQIYNVNRTEAQFEALLVILLAISNVLLVQTLMKEKNGSSK